MKPIIVAGALWVLVGAAGGQEATTLSAQERSFDVAVRAEEGAIPPGKGDIVMRKMAFFVHARQAAEDIHVNMSIEAVGAGVREIIGGVDCPITSLKADQTRVFNGNDCNPTPSTIKVPGKVNLRARVRITFHEGATDLVDVPITDYPPGLLLRDKAKP